MASKYWFANHPSGRVLAGSATSDVASIADGDEDTVAITVTGAALGDMILGCSVSVDIADGVLDAQVTAADTVTVVLANNTGGALDLASATYRVLVLPSAAVDDIKANM